MIMFSPWLNSRPPINGSYDFFMTKEVLNASDNNCPDEPDVVYLYKRLGEEFCIYFIMPKSRFVLRKD